MKVWFGVFNGDGINLNRNIRTDKIVDPCHIVKDLEEARGIAKRTYDGGRSCTVLIWDGPDFYNRKLLEAIHLPKWYQDQEE